MGWGLLVVDEGCGCGGRSWSRSISPSSSLSAGIATDIRMYMSVENTCVVFFPDSCQCIVLHIGYLGSRVDSSGANANASIISLPAAAGIWKANKAASSGSRSASSSAAASPSFPATVECSIITPLGRRRVVVVVVFLSLL